MEPNHRTTNWARQAFERAWPLPGVPDVRALLDGEDIAHAQALLDAHPDRDQKVGTGSLAFVVSCRRGDDRVHLGVLRPDGTMSRLRQTNPGLVRTDHQRILRVLRDTVAPQVLNARRGLVADGQASCAACGTSERLTADHHPVSFADLAEAWLATHPDVPLTREPIPVQAPMARASSHRLADPSQAASWMRFHRNRAQFRILCAGCNARAGRPTTPTPQEKKEGSHAPK